MRITIVPFHRSSWARLLRICWDLRLAIDLPVQAGNILQAGFPAFMEYILTGFAAEAFLNGQPPCQLSSIDVVAQRTLLMICTVLAMSKATPA